MELDTLRDDFFVRFYRWSMDDMRRELAEDFRLLRLVRSSTALRALAYFEGFSAGERVALFEAQIKAFHPRAMEILGIPLTPDEESLLQRKREALLQPTPVEVELRGGLDAIRVPRVNTSKLAKLTGQELEAGVGLPVRKWRSGAWFTVTLGDWSVSIDVSYGSPPYYLQHIMAGEEPLVQHISCLSWLGVSQQTAWDLAKKGDELETARAIATLCSHFLGAAPALLDGLTLQG